MNWESEHKPERLRILVLGYIVRGPIGGMSWHHLQYVLGLQQLGHEVVYLEDSGDTPYCCYNPETGVTDTDPGYGLRYTHATFERLGLSHSWAYYDRHQNCWHGPLAGRVQPFLTSADLLINLSCSNTIRPWLEEIPVRILVDTDPVFTQIRNLSNPERRTLAAQHNVFYTFGENIGRPDCHIPDDGFPWQPTRQPITPKAWPLTPGRPDGCFTTVMQWESYPGVEFEGRHFGLKAESFQPFFDLPQQTTQPLELAIGSLSAPLRRLQENGWQLKHPLDVSLDPWTYQAYLQGSKAEFGIAKHGYVAGNTGWFSERSAAYLACGRPVVVQETGFSNWMETGSGVLAFRNTEEARDALEQVSLDYEQHCRAARELAETYFNAGEILSRMLAQAMVTV